MTKTNAIRRARGESCMYRFGSQWQVQTYSPYHRAMWVHNPTWWEMARETLLNWRVDRVSELMGWMEDFGGISLPIVLSEQLTGSMEERINQIEKIIEGRNAT